MNIRLSIILDAIRDLRIEKHLKGDLNPSFSLCLPLPEGQEVLQEDCLYVGLLSAALQIDRRTNPAVIICLRDRFTYDDETTDMLKNLIIVNENLSSYALLSAVQERFFQVVGWKQQMDKALLNDCSLQDLVDLCPPLLNNYIQITDASFVKLAQTENDDCDCPICVKLKENGYHPEETVEKFRKYHLFDVWARLDDRIYYDESTDVAKYPTLHRVFKFHGNYYAHVVMTCNREPCSQAMKDLFQIFVEELSFCINRDWENKFSCVHPYDNFFLELIEGKITSEAELTERATRIGFPMTGQFYILNLARAPEQNVPLGTVMKDFSSRFPRFKFINHQDRIVAFIHTFDFSNFSKNQLTDSLEDFLKKQNCYCGLSTCYDSLAFSPKSFRQSALALKYGLKMRHQSSHMPLSSDLFPSNTRIFFYDQYFPFCFFGTEENVEELWFSSVYHQKLKDLHQKDLQHGTDDLPLLITYLRHERRNTEVASVLNMHRNTVIYRIRHIEDYLGIDLNDEQTRVLLMFSFIAEEYFGFED